MPDLVPRSWKFPPDVASALDRYVTEARKLRNNVRQSTVVAAALELLWEQGNEGAWKRVTRLLGDENETPPQVPMTNGDAELEQAGQRADGAREDKPPGHREASGE